MSAGTLTRQLSSSLTALIMAALTCLMIGSPDARSKSAQPSEYEVKAACLFNFAKFVTWPASSFEDDKSPIVIGIVGDDPFGSTIDSLVKNETINDRKVSIKRFKSSRDLQSCHVLFVSSSEKTRLDEILDTIGKRSVLTVSDISKFARRGGIIQFVIEDDKVRFHINVKNADKARLQISSKLLKLARVIED